MEATTGTEGKPWGIAWGELRSEGAGWKGRQGGGELRWEGAATRWTEGKPWEIAWGEVGFPGQIPSMRFSRKIVRPALFKWFAIVTCISSLAGSDTKNALLLGFSGDKFHQYDCSEKLWAQNLPKFPNPGPWDMVASLAGSETKRTELLARIFQDKFHQRDCFEKLVPKTSQTVFKRWAKGHAGHAWEKVLCRRGFHFAWRSVRRCLVFAPFAAWQGYASA